MRLRRVLRHYPKEWKLQMMAEDWQRPFNPSFGFAPELERMNAIYVHEEKSIGDP